MNDTTTDAATLFAPIWRRKWLILAVGLLVAAGTYFYYKRQPHTYVAKTSLYLGSNAEQAATGGTARSTLSSRALSDQVELINSSIIGQPVRKKLRAEGNTAAVHGKAKAVASPSSDFINITTEARTPRGAIALANGYAQAYILRQRANYLRGIRQQIATDREQLKRIETPTPGKGSKGTSGASTIQEATLESKISQLESNLAAGSGVQQVGSAKASPLPVSPSPKKNAIFGFFLGALLACVAAYVLSRLDRRLRSLAAVESVFNLEILTALPSVRSPTRRPNGERAPARPLLEPLRRLATTLQMGQVSANGRPGGPRAILFIGADVGDGESTLIANLARVRCDAGERVAVVDANLRRPSQARLLEVAERPGLSDVLGDGVELGPALQRADSAAPLRGSAEVAGDTLATAVRSTATGSLHVLPSGAPAQNPPALLGSPGMVELMRSLREDHDCVLIDVPPPLEVTDCIPLLGLVDAIIVVVRIGHTGEPSAERLAQVLARTASAPVIGVVANCVSRKDIERYGYSYAPATARRRTKLIGR